MRLFLLVALVIFIQATMVAQSPTPSAQECLGPTSEVSVTVQRDPTNEQGHRILIKNNSKDAIAAFSVGDGIKPELYASEFAVPLQILGPPGWIATHVFKEESIFMHWVWTAKNPDNRIAANTSASDFKIVLQPFPARAQNNLYPDGTSVKPIVISELPFRVQFASGRCVWGQIQPQTAGANGQ